MPLASSPSALFPPGVVNRAPGPLYHIQNELSTPTNFKGRLKDGITIFPGGVPLYNKNGDLVGAVGVSGDGVDQDDLIAYAATQGFRPKIAIRSDALSTDAIISFIQKRIDALNKNFTLSPATIQQAHQCAADLSGNVPPPLREVPPQPQRLNSTAHGRSRPFLRAVMK